MAYRATDNGLTLRQDEFAKCLAIGMDQVAAYKKCFPTAGKSADAVSQAAYRIAKKALVRVRAETFLKEAKVTDLRSVGEWYAHLQRGIAKAEADKNWTAFAALMRLDGQAQGALSETTVIRAEQSMSDETLVKQLAAKDPDLAAKFTVILGKKRAA